MPEDWSAQEVALVVADYFEMLGAELLGQPYSKSDHRRKLALLLHGRSAGSVEFKHQNISAVLITMGLPYIEGYKPRGNFQALLAKEVDTYVAGHAAFLGQVAHSERLDPKEPPILLAGKAATLFVPPPERIVIPPADGTPWISRRGRRIDFAERDARNRRLGKLGEQFVLNVEKRRLLEVGRDDLAGHVEWVSDSVGDGFGYDIRSFDETNDQERWLEVKTTG